MVLEIIAVCALRAVEEILGLRQRLSARGHRVGVGIGDACRLTVTGHARAVPEGEEEGRRRDKHDVTEADD